MPEYSPAYPLQDQNILLVVTGSVAACKTDRVLRLCQKSGADVRVLLTEAGSRFFPPQLAGALSGNEVFQESYLQDEPGRMVHIELKQWADAVLVAPATANRLLQLERSVADDLMSTVLHAFDGPILYAPAMNPDMWNEPRIQRIVQEYSDCIVVPSEGEMACGEVGPGRFPPPRRICERLTRILWPDALMGQSWVVSAGPTREAWDDVRVLTNRSSGKMGRELARVAYWLGADISLVTGAGDSHPETSCYRVIQVESAQEMMGVLTEVIDQNTGYIGAAAVSDYRPVSEPGKIRSGQDEISISLEQNPDILTELRTLYPDGILIGFSVDDREEPSTALEKLEEKQLDAIVFNPLKQENGGFDAEHNQIYLCYPDGAILNLGRRSKRTLAHQIWIGILNNDISP